jgi:FtsH-binding integral membrane protein
MAVAAAATLFTDVVYLFLDLLRLIGALRSSD